MLIVFRFLAGVAGACAITLGSATIGDMIEPHRRGIAVGLFAVGPLGKPRYPGLAGSSTDYIDSQLGQQ
jgi:MFS family permease